MNLDRQAETRSGRVVKELGGGKVDGNDITCALR